MMNVTSSWGVLLASQATMAAKALEQTSGWLSHSEQKRLAGLHSEARQTSFLGCRYALRLLLAEDEQQLTTWTLGSSAECGPWVERYADASDSGLPQLSLSHSGAWLACAKAPVPVGVDLEVQSPHKKRNVQALAELVCAPEEQRWLQAQGAELQQQCFVQLWCLKEAYFKSLGTGVDLEKIRRWAWHMHTPISVQVTQPAAYARLWQATTETGDSLYVAIWSLVPLPEFMPRQVGAGRAMKWHSVCDWLLHVSDHGVDINK